MTTSRDVPMPPRLLDPSVTHRLGAAREFRSRTCPTRNILAHESVLTA